MSTNGGGSGGGGSVVLYMNDFSHFSKKVAIGLLEKKVDYKAHAIDLKESEQMSRWFLEMNPIGEVPVLKHGDTVVCNSSPILEYVFCAFSSAI